MARVIVRKFYPHKPVFARKSFVANGRRFSSGDEFKWRSQAIMQRKVRQLYEAGYIHHQDEKPTELTSRQKNMEANAARRDKDIADNLSAIEEIPTESSETFPKHAGGPWYELSNGERVRGKEAAEEAQAKL